jgi:APA family basic amino acid/polyamine antiporter
VAVIGAYLLVNLAFFGAVPLSELVGQIPVGEIAASRTLGPVGATLINLLILSSIISSLTAMSIARPRVYFAMSRDFLFPAWLSEVDRARNVPMKSIWFQTGIAVLLISISELRDLLILSGTILVLFTTLTASALFKIARRPGGGLVFVLLYRVLPGIFVALNILILINAAAGTDWPQMRASLLVVLAGVPVYWYYQRRRLSPERQTEE